MTPNRTFRLALLVAALAALGACSSDDDDPDETPTAGGTDAPEPSTTGGGDSGTGAGTDGDETPATGVDRTDPNPRIFTSECGSLPVLDTPVSTTAGAGATLVEGQPVRGSLVDDVSHYWDIELPAGFYHVVLDGREAVARNINIGVSVVDLSDPEGSTESLVEDSDSGYGSRRVAFFEVPVARTVRFELTQNFLDEDYVFGVFPNGSDIPSPRFEDCPTITPLTLGTTEAVQIEGADSLEDEVWFRTDDLEAGVYTLDVVATRTSTSGTVAYEVFAVDGFGQIGEATETTVLDVDEVVENDGGSVVSTGTFTRASSGPVWLRLEEGGDGLDIELTLNAAAGG